MTKFTLQDTDSFLVYYGLPLSVISYLLIPFMSALWLVQCTLSTLVALVAYLLLHSEWEDAFPVGTTFMLMVVLCIAGGIIFCVWVGLFFVLYVFASVFGAALAKHNIDVAAEYLGAPEWASALVLILFISLLAFIVHKSRIMDAIGLISKVGLSSALLWLMLRVLYLENPPTMDQTLFICGTDADVPANRCPVSFDSFTWICILLGIVAIAIAMMYRCRSRSPIVDVDDDTDGEHASEKQEDAKEERSPVESFGTAKAANRSSKQKKTQTVWNTLYSKVRRSPSPPLPPPSLHADEKRIRLEVDQPGASRGKSIRRV